MTDFTPAELKALFDQLVSAVGTHEAAATFLGVSRQRIGQLISTANNDLPTWGQVAKLEQVCGQSVVFGALARRVEASSTANALCAAVEATSASNAALVAIHTAVADGIVEEAEAETIQDRARENLHAAQRQFDAAMRVRPTLKVVA